MNSAAASEPPPKSLLMIAYDFPPLLAGARRPTAFALKLPRFGWRSRVLTVKPVRTWALDPEPLERLARAGVEIARAGSWDPYRIAYCLGRRRWRGAKTAAGDFSSGKREACAAQSAGARWMAWLRRCWFCPDDRAGWIGPASRLAVRLMKASSPDAIWTTSYPHSAHLVGLRLKRRFPAIPWIADFRDGWTQNDDFFLPLSARLRRRGACLERLVAREADAIAAASEPIAAHFRDLLSAELGEAEARRRVRAIPNGFDAEDLAAAEPRPWPGFCLVYAGTLFGDRTAEPLLAAAAAAIRQSGEMARDLHLGFVGAFDESLFAAARRHGVAERLIAPGPMSHRQALGAQQSAGALAAIVPRTPNAAIMATQKIYEYLAAGPPVLLLAPDCPAKKLVESAGGGMVFDPAEPERAAAGLIAMRKQSEAGQWRRADPAVLAPFERTALTRRLADLLDSLTGD